MDNKEINYKKILVINLGGIGDLLLSTPALRALKNKFSDAKISLLVVPRAYELVKDFAFIDEVFIFHKTLRKIFKNFKVLFDLRKEHFDLAINMRTLVSKRSAREIKFLLDFIRPKIKAGRDTEGRGYFFDVKIPEKDFGERYEMEYDINLAGLLGAEVIDKNIDFKIDKTDLRKVDEILNKEGISEKDILIGIHPGGEPSRRWPIENFAKVMININEKISCKFVITGTIEENNLADKLIKITKLEAINFMGKLKIKELAALIKRCRLFITNDTGPMHIAAILQTSLVAIFGPGWPARYDPRNISDKAIVLYQKVDCSPCNKVSCADLKCLKIISPKEVTDAVSKLLGLE
ncbi:MAG: glycosyltransferase family 9 protein [Candidatus Omnitrophica bacterium]|nr:glycosyltransferase family 9 protein [Candidatus Omnitrophota bacterium]MCM8770473.1 glycosyltransferase family 9 protein [Candidatus Omnitrophota bacterium]